MTTPHVLDQLPLWVEGDLSETERVVVDNHLAQCPACREVAEQLKVSQSWLREAMASPFEAVDQDRLRRRVMERIRAEAPAKQVRHLAIRPALLAACAASLLLAGFFWRQGPPVPSHPPQPSAPQEGAPRPSPPAPLRAVAVRQDPPFRAAQRRTHFIRRAEAPPPAGPTRIEFQTADPTIRIIWLAQSKSLPDPHPSLEEKS